MKVLELFAGTRSIGRAFERRGHEVFSVDWGDFENIDLKTDISALTAAEVISRFGRPDVIWASSDCPSPGFRFCKRGAPCHEAAPRGAKTGTQGIKGKKERAVIPPALCDYIADLCEKYVDTRE